MAALDPRTVIPNLGRRIGELREHRGLTKERLAERLDVSVQYVSRVEKGTNLTVESLVKVANVLGVGIPDLFTLPTTPPRRRGRPRTKKRRGA